MDAVFSTNGAGKKSPVLLFLTIPLIPKLWLGVHGTVNKAKLSTEDNCSFVPCTDTTAILPIL